MLSISLASAGISGDGGADLKLVSDDFLSKLGAEPTTCLPPIPILGRKSLHSACGESAVPVKKMQELVLDEMRRREWSVQAGWATASIAGEKSFVIYGAHDGHAVSVWIAGSRNESTLLYVSWEEEWPPAEEYKDAVRPAYMTDEFTPPKRTQFVQPKYPEDARRARREGRSILEIVVNKKGVVKDLRILKSNPLFDEAAMKAVRKWKYQPALKDGEPVPVFITVIVDFNLK